MISHREMDINTDLSLRKEVCINTKATQTDEMSVINNKAENGNKPDTWQANEKEE